MRTTLDSLVVGAWTLGLGAVGFSIGFFGPIVTVLDGSQGPLAGIFITGPLGAALGLGVGLVRAQRTLRRRLRHEHGPGLHSAMIERAAGDIASHAG